MKTIAITIAVATTLLFSGVAFAQDEDAEPLAEFITVDDMLITGDTSEAGLSVVRARERSKFGSQLSIKKSFMSRIQVDAQELSGQ